jgi:hypothetical protein
MERLFRTPAIWQRHENAGANSWGQEWRSNMETTEVEVIDLQTELQIFDPIAAQIEEMKEKNANLVFDYEDKDGNKNARSHIATLRKLKKPITETHRLAKAEAKKFCDALDGKKRELIGIVEDMIEVHHKPIWEIEQREIAKKAEEELRIQQEKEAEEAARLAEIEAREKAAAEKEAELKRQQEEIERKEREAQLVAEAEERAKEKAKQDLIDAENRRIAEVQAEKNRAAAEIAAKEKAIAEEKRADEAARLELEAQEQERQANIEHRKQIHKDIYQGFCALKDVYDTQTAVAITKAVIDGKIPHVTIQY